MKVAFVDVDGVIANNTERFDRARKHSFLYLCACVIARYIPHDRLRKRFRRDKINWRVALDPDLVELDTLIDGAVEAVQALAMLDYIPVYLTGRPENMRDATKIWLATHNIPAGVILMRKDGDFRHAGLVKADFINTYLEEHEDVEAVVLVDDEASNTSKIFELTPLGSQESAIAVYTASSLTLIMMHYECEGELPI